MDEVANLQIRVESLEVEQAQRRLDKLPGSAAKAEKATDNLAAGFKNLVGALVAVETARRGLDKLVEVQRTFDKLNAGLITATGSSLKAGEAFEVLQKFAQDTPYGLEQATEGFVKLVNLGLTPSERALTSYGNTAAAMGKDLNQMIEAVADAATGEFERLKEFGIKAKQQGDEVSFTFQGTTTKIKNNAADIEEYLLKIGEVNFAGAMKERMNSLDGDIANLSDTWDNLFLNISKQGVGDAIRATVQTANEALQELNDMVASGELKGYLEAAVHSFDSWATDVSASIKFVEETYSDFGKTTQMEGEGVVNFLIDAFSRFPQNVRAFIQIMTTEVLAGFDKAEALAVSFKDAVKAIFTDDTQEAVNQRYNARLAAIDNIRQDSIASILEERDADLNATNARIAAAQKLREQYEADRKKREADRQDRLAKYKIDAKDDGDSGPTKAELAAQKKAEREAAALAKKNQTEYDQVVAGLRTQEEAIQFSYDKRLEIIKKNTDEESSVRADLIRRLEKDRQKELDAARGIEEAYAKNVRLAKEVQEIQEDGWDDATKAAAAYQKQMETLWQAMLNGTISQDQHEKMVEQVTKAYEKQGEKGTQTFIDLDAFGKKAAENIQDAFADFLFDPFAEGLDGMALGFAKVLQRMAAEAAAAKLAQGLFGSMGGGSGSGWLGMAATAIGSYFGGPSGGAAAASMSAGASQSGYSMDLSGFTPGKAAGGPTVGGQLYEVNERAPEIFSTGGRDYMLSPTAGVVSNAQQGQMSGGVTFTQTVTVHNNGQAEAETKSSVTNEQAAAFGEKMRQVTVQVIMDEQRPGGLLYGT